MFNKLRLNPNPILLSREDFKQKVLSRDRHQCVICQQPATDAHHIMERKLFPDEGYYLENGVSLCPKHHLDAELTLIDCETLYQSAEIVLPPHLYPDQRYDKWGNSILEDNSRSPGDLFFEPHVQQILQETGLINLFILKFKYPRTFHLPWSPGATKDDRILQNTNHFTNQETVTTIKMDGENTTLYNDDLHARSLSYSPHPSRGWIKNFHNQIKHNIPPGWRICGENLYAKHSIAYSNLPSFFLVFSIWDQSNTCLSWQDTLDWCQLLDLHPVPTAFIGPFDETTLKNFHPTTWDNNPCEGYVTRLTKSFHYKNFQHSIAKYVRPNHVQTTHHWMRQPVTPNTLKEKP